MVRQIIVSPLAKKNSEFSTCHDITQHISVLYVIFDCARVILCYVRSTKPALVRFEFVAPRFQHVRDFRSWSLDPTERYTAWGSLVGAAFLHCAVYGVNQLQVQRYLTVPTIQAARKYATKTILNF